MASLDEKQQYVSTFVFNVPNTNKHEPTISNIHETVKIHWRGTMDYGNLYLHFRYTHSVQMWEEIVSNFVTVKIGAWSTHLSPNDTFKASFRRLCSEAITYYLWWNDGWTFHQKYYFVQILIHNLFTQKKYEIKCIGI